MQPDTPISDDRSDFFGYGPYADAVAELITNDGTDTPVTLAISGPMGAGKTSLANMIDHRLSEPTAPGERPSVTCWFNPWMHNDAPHLGAAMAACVATVANENRPFWRRLIEPLPSAMLSSRGRWRRGLCLSVLAYAIAFFALLIEPVRVTVKSIPILSQTGAAEASSAVGVAVLLVLLLGSRLSSALGHAARFVDDPASEAARGSIFEVGEQLGRLVRQAARGRRLVVFVDDLDRCVPDERPIEVCEVASQLLSCEDVVIVFIADMHVIAKSAEQHYANVTEVGESGRRYLEKIVQIQLTLPPPGKADMERLLAGQAPDQAHRRQVKKTAVDELSTSLERLPLLAFSRLFVKVRDAPWALLMFPIGLFGGFRLGATFNALWADTRHTRPVVGASNSSNGIEQALGLPGGASVSDIVLPTITATQVALFITWCAASAIARYRRYRARNTRQRIKQIISEQIQAGTDQSELEAAVVGAVKKGERDTARKQVSSYLVDCADELQRVEEVIRRYPARLPREAKRTLNHARLLTQIARARKIFGGNPALTPEHLGEWIVLNERWPTIAREVEREPAVLGLLETIAKEERREKREQLRREVEQLLGKDATGDVAALFDLLTGEPDLGNLVSRLARFEPATTDS